MGKFVPNVGKQKDLGVVSGVEVLRPAHGGTCFAVDEAGKPLFISHALPGEVVDVQLTKQRAKVAFGDAVKVISASEFRQDQVWAAAGPDGVGGVDLGHVRLDYQRVWKAEVIKDQLRRIGGESVVSAVAAVGEVVVVPASADRGGSGLHSRTRVEFEVTKGGRLAMSKALSNDLVEVSDMPLAVEQILDLDLFGDSRWQRLWRPGKRVRALAPNGGGRRVVIGNQTFNSRGRRVENFADWQVSYGDLTVPFSVHSQGFWQAHRSAPQDLVQIVLDEAQVLPGDAVVELYSGAGLFSYFLALAAGRDGRFLSVEGSVQAVEDARHNLRGLDTPRDLRVGNVDARAMNRAWSDLGERPRVVVLDPPRTGAGAGLVQAIGLAGPERVVLVSCDPAAAARDMRDFLAAGFTLENLYALDLFPHTHHVEMVSVFSR